MRYFTVALVLLLGSLSAQAAPILSTNFDGRTVSGPTASNITWVTNGVANPGDLTAASNPDGLFDTTAAQDRFVPNRNLHNEGDWSVDIFLALLDADIALGTVTLDAFIFNNDGLLQTVGRDLDLSLSLLDGTMAEIVSVQRLDIYPTTQTSITQPQSVSFDLSSNLLLAQNSYTLRLRAFGQGGGNNAGFDNLLVNGELIPTAQVSEPAPFGLLILGALVMLIAQRQRRQRL